MKFSLEGKEIELRGIKGKLDKVISSNGMTKMLRKGKQGVIENYAHYMFKHISLLFL
jgi:hypothetical protein